MRHLWLVLTMLTALCGGAVTAEARISTATAKQIVREFNDQPRSVRLDHELLPVTYVELGGQIYGFALPRRFARLARDGAAFKIRDVKLKNRQLNVEVESDLGARVKLQLYAEDQRMQGCVDDLLPYMLHSVFEFGDRPAAVVCVVNTQSGLAHLGSCNHLPEASLRQAYTGLTAAIADGRRPCGACYPSESLLPYDNYASLRNEATERARLFEQAFPLVADTAIGNMVEEVGTRLVSNLPFESAGFEYTFKVVHSNYANAMSISTGFVYVTDSLLNLIEDPVELEFILAHEIAHCELGLPPIGGQVPDFDPVLPNYYERLFLWEQHQEATSDLLGLLCVQSGSADRTRIDKARSIIAKLQFANEGLPNDETDPFDTHPSFSDRMRLFDPRTFVGSGCHEAIEIEDKEGFVMRVLGKVQGSTGAFVYLLVEGTDLANAPLAVGPGCYFSAKTQSGRKFRLTAGDFAYAIGPGDVLVIRAKLPNTGDFADFDVENPLKAIAWDAQTTF